MTAPIVPVIVRMTVNRTRLITPLHRRFTSDSRVARSNSNAGIAKPRGPDVSAPMTETRSENTGTRMAISNDDSVNAAVISAQPFLDSVCPR